MLRFSVGGGVFEMIVFRGLPLPRGGSDFFGASPKSVSCLFVSLSMDTFDLMNSPTGISEFLAFARKGR